jgi:hypothetical protein
VKEANEVTSSIREESPMRGKTVVITGGTVRRIQGLRLSNTGIVIGVYPPAPTSSEANANTAVTVIAVAARMTGKIAATII